MPCSLRFSDKHIILSKGEKPDYFPKNQIITKREYKRLTNSANKKNPILEADSYLKYLESSPKLTYQDVADKFNISKARVGQMVALVKKLPNEITDNFTNEDETIDLNFFTERRLRPLTLLDSDESKIDRFRKMSQMCFEEHEAVIET